MKVSASFITLKEKKKWSSFVTTSLTLGLSVSALFAGGLVSKGFLTFIVQIRQIKTDKMRQPTHDCGHRYVLLPL